MAASAVVTLMTLGLRAVTNAITSGEPIEVISWELGSLAGGTVPANATSAIPNTIYTGSPSKVTVQAENGVAVLNIAVDETVGDFFVGNLALRLRDPVTLDEVLLGVVMFPTTIYKTKKESSGGAVGETGNNFVVKLAIQLSTSQAVATIALNNTVYTSIPSVDSIDDLADPSTTTYPHQIMQVSPETGAPSLLAKRSGDNMWWGFSLSWPVNSHMFGVVSGGYQGDWYGQAYTDVVFGGHFYMSATDYDPEPIFGGSNWESGSIIDAIDGGTWSQ